MVGAQGACGSGEAWVSAPSWISTAIRKYTWVRPKAHRIQPVTHLTSPSFWFKYWWLGRRSRQPNAPAGPPTRPPLQQVSGGQSLCPNCPTGRRKLQEVLKQKSDWPRVLFFLFEGPRIATHKKILKNKQRWRTHTFWFDPSIHRWMGWDKVQKSPHLQPIDLWQRSQYKSTGTE